MDPSEVKEQFQAITHATDQKADFYLSAADGDLQRAVEMFLTSACPCLPCECCALHLGRPPLHGAARRATSPAAVFECGVDRGLGTGLPLALRMTTAKGSAISAF